MGLLGTVVDQEDFEFDGTYEQESYDEANDILIVRTIQDVEPYIEKNKALMREAEEGNGGYFMDRTFRRAASIPLIFWHMWKNEGVDICDSNDWPEVKRRLNSREWSALRTAPGRI